LQSISARTNLAPALDRPQILNAIVEKFGESRVRRAFLLGLTLSLAGVVILRGIGKGEFSLNVDEIFHACTGLYVASFLHDLPLRHPVAYTYVYYAHYPALELIAYPPVFYLAEGVSFLILGPSAVTARLTVLLFALFGLFFWFRLVAVLQDESTAAIATLLVAFLPSVLLYEKAAMLEVPALSFCLAAADYWVRYLSERTPRHLYCFAIFATLALLTKVQTIYLAPWCLLSVAVSREWRAVLNRATLIALVISAALVLPYYYLSFAFAGPVARANVGQGGHPVAHPFLYYLAQLPSQIGWIVLALALIGIVTSWLWETKRNSLIMLTWIVACYATETAIANKEARYAIYWIPPLVYFAVAPLGSLLRRPGWILRIPAAAAVLALLASVSVPAWSYQRPYVTGYSQLARRLLSEPGGYVLSDTPLDANVIFFARAFDPARRFIIDRKALYVTNQVKEYGYHEFAHSTDDVRRIIERKGIRYIIVDSETKPLLESQRYLREALKEPQFKPLDRVRIDSNIREYAGDTLLLFENTQARPPATGTYRIRMLTMDHDITVPVASLYPRSKP
jgi:Dolichyl-phosphate-mannose-protein mannosyltransferase